MNGGADPTSPYALGTGDKLALVGGMLSGLAGNTAGMQNADAVVKMRQQERMFKMRQAALSSLTGAGGGTNLPMGSPFAPAGPASEQGVTPITAAGPRPLVARGPQGDLASRSAAFLAGGGQPDELNAYIAAKKFDQPDLTPVNGLMLDKNDAANAGRYVPQLDKGQTFLYDEQGRIAGLKNLDGSVQAAGAMTRATEDAKNASAASYAKVIEGGKAAGSAPYQDVSVPTPSGAPRVMSREQFAAQQGGGFVGQSPDDAKYKSGQADQAVTTYNSMQAAGTSAMSRKAQYQQIDSLLQGWEGSKLSPISVDAAKVLNGFGIKADQKMTNAEASAALVNQLALKLRDPASGGGMPGSMSNADRNFLVASIPSMQNTSAGRRQMVRMGMSIADRDAAVAGMARKWNDRYGRIDKPDPTGKGFQDYLQMWSEKNPLFAK